MKLSQLQQFFAEQLAASAALQPFMPVLTFSNLDDVETLKTAIAASLRERAVCLHIGPATAPATDTDESGASVLQARIELFIAESPTVAHELRDIELAEAVAEAITTRRTDTFPGRKTPKLRGYESDEENGYLLHILEFSMPVQIP